MSFRVITAVNKINSETLKDSEEYAGRWQSYTSALGHDYTTNGYIGYYVEKNNQIKKDIDNLNKIAKLNLDDLFQNDSRLIVLKNTTICKNLQAFMKFDRELYTSDDEVRQVLINKLKSINFIYVLEGVNSGKKRIFRQIIDLDFEKLLEVYSREQEKSDEVSDDRLISEFKQMIKQNVTDIPEVYLDLKTKIVAKYNGSAEIDMVTLDFKDEISDSIDKQVLKMTNEEIREQIELFEKESSVDIFVNKYGMSDKIVETDNNVLLETKLKNLITSFCDVFECTDSSGNIVAELQKLQRDPKAKERQINQYLDNLINLDNLMKIKRNISEIISSAKSVYKKEDIISNLTSVCSLEAIYDEDSNNINKLINIEFVNNDDVEEEKKLRNNILTQTQSSNSIYIQLGILRYTTILFSQIVNSKKYEKDIETLKNKQNKFNRQLINELNQDELVVIKDTLLDITTNDHPIDVNDDLFKKSTHL